MEDAKLFVVNLLLAIQDSDDERLKEMLRMNSSDIMKKSKVLSKTLRQNTEKPRQKLSLVSAIEENDRQKVRNLLENGSDCNVIQESSFFTKHREAFYPIHTAVTLDSVDITEILLTAGARPNVFDHCGNTPLHIAVSRGNTMTTKLLLSFGADPALADRHGNASIHSAASQGHLNIVRTLVEFDADVHQTNSFGYRPIHLAAAAGHFHITHLLCSVDASNIAARSGDGQFPLHLAAENGHVETVTALLDLFAADPNERNSSGETPVVRLLRKPYRGRAMRDMESYYATFMALVQFGASLDVVDSNGKPILDLAVDNQYTKIASALKALREGDDVIHRVKHFCSSRDMNTLNGPAKSNDVLDVHVNSFSNGNAEDHDLEQCLLTQDLEFSSFHSQKIDQKTFSDSKETSFRNSLHERTPSDLSVEISHLPQNISNGVKSENAQRSNPDIFVEKTSKVTKNQTHIAKTSHHFAETAGVRSSGSHIQHDYVNEIPQHDIKLNTEKKPKTKRKCFKLPAPEGNESSLGTELAINTYPVEAEIGKQSGLEAAASSSREAGIGQKKLTKSGLQDQMPNKSTFHVKRTSVSDAAGSKSVKSKKKSKPGNERNEKPGRSFNGELMLLNGDSLCPSTETPNAHWPQEALTRTNSSKVGIKRKKRKNAPTTAEPNNGLSTMADHQECNKMNSTSQKEISRLEEYGVTDVDSIPFYTDFSSEDRGFQCHGLKEHLDSESEYSGGQLKERHNNTREIQSELCSAFGISKETNIDDIFLNTNGQSGNNNTSELELFCELNEFHENMQQIEERKSFPRKSKLSGKSKALHKKSFEIVFNTDRNHPEDSRISSASCDVEVSNGRVCNRKRIKSPCFCLKLDSGNTHSSPSPPEKEEQEIKPKSFIADRDHHSSVSYSSSNSNSYGLQIANVSKETCIDDDDCLDERSDEQKMSPNQPLLCHSDYGFKETDIDEVFCCDKTPLRYDLQPSIGDYSAPSVYTDNVVTVTDVSVCGDKLNVNGTPVVDDRSVLVDLPHKKKLPKKKKLKNNSVGIPDPLIPVSVSVQLNACGNSSHCSNIQSKAHKKQIHASSEIIEARFEEYFDRGKNENKDLLDGKINLTVEDNDVDKQPSDDRTEVGQQSSDEANITEEQAPKKGNENDEEDETLSVQEDSTAPSSADEEDDDLETELPVEEALGNNFDDTGKDVIFGQSCRVLFTIQEMNAEETEKRSRPVVEKIVKCDSSEEQDEWDDLDLSKSLEKIKLKGQILNIQRHLYDETDEEEKEEKNLNNAYNSSTKDLTSPMLKSFTISPLMVDKTFAMPGLVANGGRRPFRQSGCSSVTKPSCNRCDDDDDDDDDMSGSEEDKPEDCSETSRTQMKKQMSDKDSFIETSFDGLEPVSQPLSNAECPSDRAADTSDNSSAVVLRCDVVSDSHMNQLHATSDKEPSLCKPTEFAQNLSEIPEVMKQNRLVLLATNDSDDITKERIVNIRFAEEEVDDEEEGESEEEGEDEEEDEEEEDDDEEDDEEEEKEKEELEGEKKDGIKQEREKQEEIKENIIECHNVLDLKPIIDSSWKEEDFSEHLKSNRIPSGQHSPINEKKDDQELENKSDRNEENAAVIEKAIKEFSTSKQMDGLGKRDGKTTIHRPLKVGNNKNSLLVFESAPETDKNAKPSLAEHGLESNKPENFSKSGSKSVSFNLPSHFEKAQSNSPILLDDTHSNESVCRLKSDVTLSDKQKPYGKPPVPQHINKRNVDESINKMTSPRTIVSGDRSQANVVKISPTTSSSPGSQSDEIISETRSRTPRPTADKLSNNSHAVTQKESKPGLSGIFSNVRNPKFLIESNLIRQNSRSNKIPMQHTLAQQRSHEDGLFSKKSHKSAKHNSSFERPRSAEGILEAQRYQPRRPSSSRQSVSSEMRSPDGTRNESAREERSNSAKEPQRTLQEAAFESIRASILSQPKQQTRRSVKQSAVPLSYRPQSVSFRGSLSHNASQTSADFGDHQSTQSANNSWQGDF